MDDAMLAASGMMPGVTAKAMLDVGDDDDYKHTDYKHVVDDDDEGVPDAEGGLSWTYSLLQFIIERKWGGWVMVLVLS